MHLSNIRRILRSFCLILIPIFLAGNIYGQTPQACPTCALINAVADQQNNDLLDTPFPPKDLEGKQKFNRFKIINVITWKNPSCGVEPLFYEIYRDASLTKILGRISANSELKFKDQVRGDKKKSSYFLVSVDAEGRKSVPIGIVFKGGKTHITPSKPPAQALLLRPHFSPLSIGDQIQLQTYAVLADCSLQRVTNFSTWDSSDRTIVDIDQNGNATAIRPGTADISAQVGQTTTQISLTVTEATLVRITIVPSPPITPVRTIVGGSGKFKAIGFYNQGPEQDITDSVTWNSDPSGIVSFKTAFSVPLYEEAIGISGGTTNITASLGSITSNAIPMIVTSLDQLERIVITPSSQELPLSDLSAIFLATGFFNDGTQAEVTGLVEWRSSDSFVALRTFPGIFDLYDVGTVTITASYGNIKDQATLTVSP
jgi:hypothetical protein